MPILISIGSAFHSRAKSGGMCLFMNFPPTQGDPMGLASLCLGIASVVLAALATAPCFGCASLLGLPLACLALIFGVTCLIRQALRRKKEGVPVEQDEWRYALSGIALSLVAGLWQVVIVVITKGIVL